MTVSFTIFWASSILYSPDVDPRKKQALDIGPPEKLDRHCSTMYMKDHLMLIIFQ